MTRLSLFAFVVLLAACAEPDAPAAAGTETPDVLTPVEAPASAADSVAADPYAFRIDGAAGPMASYALDGGGECLVYGGHVVRMAPIEEDSEQRTLEVIARDASSPFEVCDRDGEVELPYRPATDAFVALDGTTVWTRRDVRGRDNLIGYDFETEETVFEESVTFPVDKDAEGLTYGGPPEAMASRDALDAAAVACPEAEAWFEAGRAVAISRRLRFAFATGETTDLDEAVCFVQDA